MEINEDFVPATKKCVEIEELDDGCILYDTEKDEAHSLNITAASVCAITGKDLDGCGKCCLGKCMCIHTHIKRACNIPRFFQFAYGLADGKDMVLIKRVFK
jgi:hypothetical protein